MESELLYFDQNGLKTYVLETIMFMIIIINTRKTKPIIFLIRVRMRSLWFGIRTPWFIYSCRSRNGCHKISLNIERQRTGTVL